jgi:hypothetical protein
MNQVPTQKYSPQLKIVVNLKEGLLEKSKLAQHAYEQGHRVGWDEARVLKIESNNRYRIGPYGMLNQSDQPTQFGHFSHLDPPHQQ